MQTGLRFVGMTERWHSVHCQYGYHALKLMTSTVAPPGMRFLMLPRLAEFKDMLPVIFDDIEVAA